MDYSSQVAIVVLVTIITFVVPFIGVVLYMYFKGE